MKRYWLDDYTSFETWYLLDWLKNNPKQHAYWTKKARRLQHQVEKAKLLWNPEEFPIEHLVSRELADQMKNKLLTRYRARGFCADLFEAALGQIDWLLAANELRYYEPSFSKGNNNRMEETR